MTRYEIRHALHEETNNGWVWVCGPSLKDYRSRTVVKIKRSGQWRRLYTEIRKTDSNFEREYNDGQSCRIKISADTNIIVMSEWYRTALGIIVEDVERQVPIALSLIPVRWWGWRAIRASCHYPDLVARLATRLGVFAIWLSLLALLPVFFDFLQSKQWLQSPAVPVLPSLSWARVIGIGGLAVATILGIWACWGAPRPKSRAENSGPSPREAAQSSPEPPASLFARSMTRATWASAIGAVATAAITVLLVVGAFRQERAAFTGPLYAKQIDALGKVFDTMDGVLRSAGPIVYLYEPLPGLEMDQKIEALAEQYNQLKLASYTAFTVLPHAYASRLEASTMAVRDILDSFYDAGFGVGRQSHDKDSDAAQFKLIHEANFTMARFSRESTSLRECAYKFLRRGEYLSEDNVDACKGYLPNYAVLPRD